MELICAECKNKWMPSNRINEVICPYCGNIIGELSRDFSSFEDGIAYIRNMFGDDLNKGDFSLYARNIVLTIMKRKYQLLRFCMILD